MQFVTAIVKFLESKEQMASDFKKRLGIMSLKVSSAHHFSMINAITESNCSLV